MTRGENWPCRMNRIGIAGGSISCEIGVMTRPVRYSPEARDRAVRMVLEHQKEYGSQWEALFSLAAKIGCTPKTRRTRVRRAELDRRPR